MKMPHGTGRTVKVRDHRTASYFNRRLWCLVRALFRQLPDGPLLGGADCSVRFGLRNFRVLGLFGALCFVLYRQEIVTRKSLGLM